MQCQPTLTFSGGTIDSEKSNDLDLVHREAMTVVAGAEAVA